MSQQIRWAKSPEIMRAYQRDVEYKLMFKFAIVEFLESRFDYRVIRKYQAEIKCLSDLIFTWMTTVRGR